MRKIVNCILVSGLGAVFLTSTAFAATPKTNDDALVLPFSKVKLENPVQPKTMPAEPVKAYLTTPDGKMQEVQPVKHIYPKSQSMTSNSAISPMVISPNSWTDSSGYIYVYDHYNQSSKASDIHHFKIGNYSLENYGSGPQTMIYQQTTTHTSTWTTTGRVAVEAGLKIDLIASAKQTFGLDVSYQTSTSVGTTFGGTYTVPAHTMGTLTCYDEGVYSGGAAVYNKYSPSGTSLMGIYTETGDTAWTVATNSKHLVYQESAL